MATDSTIKQKIRIVRGSTISSWRVNRLVFLKISWNWWWFLHYLILFKIDTNIEILSQFQNSQSLSINSPVNRIWMPSRRHWNFQSPRFSFSFSLKILQNPQEYMEVGRNSGWFHDKKENSHSSQFNYF